MNPAIAQITAVNQTILGALLGAAYQIDEKTVLRVGWGISYAQLTGWAGSRYDRSSVIGHRGILTDY